MIKKAFSRSLNELFAARGLITAEELQARKQEQQEIERQYTEDFEAARRDGNTYMFMGCIEVF